jgi:ubiquinone/menaquinone biosynthesis C-methylase UbiE
VTELFEGAARYYARYRPGYPVALVEHLIHYFSLDASTPVLDLGCGTGQLAIPLATAGIPVVAVDPDVEMLREGLLAERNTTSTGVAWRLGSDTAVSRLSWMPMRLCAMAASFHWMDRDAVLADLDRVVDARGGVAVISRSGGIWSNSDLPPWAEAVRQRVVQFLGPVRRAGSGTYSHPADRHEVVLAHSPFGRVETWDVDVEESLTIEHIVGLQLSMSYATPQQLGSHVGDFCAAIESDLRSLEPTGVFTSQSRVTALLATRA